jgi:hypothetical protein
MKAVIEKNDRDNEKDHLYIVFAVAATIQIEQW